MHLDTVCTMVDVDKIVMYPNVADSLEAYAVTCADRDGRRRRRPGAARSRRREPFLVAAAKAMSIDTLHQIDTGLDPVTAEREQWDDGNNTLALSPARGRGLRAQRRDQQPARGGRHRGRRDRRLGAGIGTRRAALHVLPGHPRAAADLTARAALTLRRMLSHQSVTAENLEGK